MFSVKVKDVMHKGVITCHPNTPLREVVRVLCDTDIQTIAVESPLGEVIGIISHLDILAHYRDANLDRGVAADVMSHKVIAISPDAPLDEAIHIMVEKRIRFLVVTEEGPEGRTPVGVLSTTDVIRHLRGPKWMWYHPENALTVRPRLKIRSGSRN
mgnify:CR=1 FL=1